MGASRPMDHGMVTGFPLGEAFFLQPLPTSVGPYRSARCNSLLSAWLFCCCALLISKSKWSGELLLVPCNEDKVPPATAGMKIKVILPHQAPPFHLSPSPNKHLLLP